MKRYFFIDNNIYYQNYKMPARAEEDLIIEESD